MLSNLILDANLHSETVLSTDQARPEYTVTLGYEVNT
jgi:hypothetical protein